MPKSIISVSPSDSAMKFYNLCKKKMNQELKLKTQNIHKSVKINFITPIENGSFIIQVLVVENEINRYCSQIKVFNWKNRNPANFIKDPVGIIHFKK